MLGGTSPTSHEGIRPFYLLLLKASLGLTVTWRRRNKLINGNIQWGGRKFLGHFIRHNRSQNNIVRIIHKLWQRSQISSKSSKQGHTKRINPKFATESEFNHICVLRRIRMFLSDIWSRSNFCGGVTVHASRVPMSAKQSIVYSPIYTLIYRLNQWLLLQMLASFARSYLTLFEWLWWYLWLKMAFKMSQEFPSVSALDHYR